MRSIFRAIWKWSPLFTLPIAIGFLLWVSAVSNRYSAMGIRYEANAEATEFLHPIMELEWFLLKRKANLLVAPKPGAGELAKIPLWIPESHEQELNDSLPESGFEYIDGALSYPDGTVQNASIRYRGDMIWHWNGQKKSFRVKTKKKALWKGIRKLNFIIPETQSIIEGHLGFWLGRELGLLAPRSDVVEVLVNGENRGVFNQVEQLDETFLRTNQRMPGDLFAGELLGKDYFGKEYDKLFDLPGTWHKAAINNHYPENHYAAIQRLCDVLDWPTGGEKEAALDRIVDLEAFGKFAAYRMLVQSGHFDWFHNWRLYYDPWRNKMEPIVWDPNAWHIAWIPNDREPEFEWPVFCELDHVLTLDHRYRWAMHRSIVRFFEQGGRGRLFQEWSRYRPKTLVAVARDPALTYGFEPYGTDEVVREMDILESRIGDYLDVAYARHVGGSANVSRGGFLATSEGEHSLHLRVDGWKPIAGLQLSLDRNVPPGSRFFWGVYREGRWEERAALAQVEGSSVRFSQPLLPGVRTEAYEGRPPAFFHVVRPRPLLYRLRMEAPNFEPSHSEFSGSDGGLQVLGARAFDLLGEAQSIELDEGIDTSLPVLDASIVSDPGDSMVPNGGLLDESGALFASQRASNLVWDGVRTLSGLNEIHGTLILEPGTVLEMEPGASLIVHGRLHAVGTKTHPIAVRRADTTSGPWGTLAIRSPAADGSRLEHVSLTGGSGYKDDLQEYSAMLSIHDADGVRLRACSFDDSSVVDDMVHVVYGRDIAIEDCVFRNAISDALDLDACSGLLTNCQFESSGNDAIDLMMSHMEVHETTILGSGDKGVSVGEGSQVLVRGCHIELCGIGVQVKDGSLAWIQGGTLERNGLALDAYKKNWQYDGGGHGIVREARVVQNQTLARADQDSSWILSELSGVPKDFEQLSNSRIKKLSMGAVLVVPEVFQASNLFQSVTDSIAAEGGAVSGSAH